MPDITMCMDMTCEQRQTCYRFTATPNPWRQSYFMESPRSELTCDHYWETEVQQPKVKNEKEQK